MFNSGIRIKQKSQPKPVPEETLQINFDDFKKRKIFAIIKIYLTF